MYIDAANANDDINPGIREYTRGNIVIVLFEKRSISISIEYMVFVCIGSVFVLPRPMRAGGFMRHLLIMGKAGKVKQKRKRNSQQTTMVECECATGIIGVDGR